MRIPLGQAIGPTLDSLSALLPEGQIKNPKGLYDFLLFMAFVFTGVG
jgi:hypothetical protein